AQQIVAKHVALSLLVDEDVKRRILETFARAELVHAYHQRTGASAVSGIEVVSRPQPDGKCCRLRRRITAPERLERCGNGLPHSALAGAAGRYTKHCKQQPGQGLRRRGEPRTRRGERLTIHGVCLAPSRPPTRRADRQDLRRWVSVVKNTSAGSS